MRFAAVILVFFFSSFSFVSAQADSSTFNIKVFGAVDTLAPSTPTLLTATPIAPNQIDLTWSTSTDNFSVAGYVVTRASTTIATTTLRSYSDTSVSASTTYSYTVQAFDAAYNYSSSSNALSTTTPAVPVVQPDVDDASPTQGTIARIVVDDFTVTPGYSTTSLDFKTATPVVVSLRWGRTVSYELGYVTNDTYARENSVLLTELEPGTTYQYEVTAATPFGLRSVIQSGTFTTLQTPTTHIPSNVARFQAVGNGDDVRLSWQRSVAEPGSYVRIVRSHLGFPAHPQDGAIVYQGRNTTAVDEDVLSQFSPVYYTAFTYTAHGKVSSGAVAVVYAQSVTAPEPGFDDSTIPPDSSIGTPIPTDEATSTINQEYVKPDMDIPELSEVYVRQGEHEFSFIGNRLVLNSEASFTVAIPKSAVAGNLKSIIGTLVDPTDNRQRYSFLLRINADDTRYEADIAALSVQGKSTLVVEIYDYEAAIVAKYQTPIEFVKPPPADAVVFPDELYERSHWLLLASVLPFALAFLLIILYRKRAEDNRL